MAIAAAPDQAQLRALLAEAVTATIHLRQADRLHGQVAMLHHAVGEREDAVDVLTQAASLATGRPEACEALGYAAYSIGEHGLSHYFYGHAARQAPHDATCWYNLATANRNLGRFAEAEDNCDRALSLDPALAQAALLRAQVRTQTHDANHVADLRRRLQAQPLGAPARIFLHYALGKELDDLGEHDAAFQQFADGAAARRASLRYDVAEDERKLKRIIEAFDISRLQGAPPLQSPVRHGFIIGLPRSGTTLTERILTGAAGVVANGETDNLVTSLMEGAAKGDADIFDRVAAADPAQVAAAYERRAGHGPRAQLVLEKMPMNYLYAGAIRLCLPEARVVLIERCPGDNLLAMYTTLFGAGYPFSYDLVELARYYAAYRRLIDHWADALGEQLLRIEYEALVADPLSGGGAMARHMGVMWQDSMVRVQDNRSATSTASAEQVRRPIYRTAVRRWRKYARQLQPLADALDQMGLSMDWSH